MTNDHPGMAPGSCPVHTAPVLPGGGCPAWCDGQHEVDDQDAAFHGRIVAQRGDASVALSGIEYHDPVDTGSTVIILDVDATAEPTELEESDAIRLISTLEAASWLTVALRSALELLDPGAGWTRPLSRTRRDPGSPDGKGPLRRPAW
jgi:hypothetical protein